MEGEREGREGMKRRDNIALVVVHYVLFNLDCVFQKKRIWAHKYYQKTCVTQTKGPDAFSKRVHHNQQCMQTC